MKLYIDSCHPDDMQIQMTPEEEISIVAGIQELSFGLAGLSLNYILCLQDTFSPTELNKVKEYILGLLSLILTKALEGDIPPETVNDDKNDAHDIKELIDILSEAGVTCKKLSHRD